MGIPYKQLLNEIDYESLLTYLAYNIIEPFAEFREDERNALIATLIHNSNISNKSDSKDIKDFMLRSSEIFKTERMSTEQMLAQAKAYASQF